MRQIFNNWKTNSDMLEVVRFQNEEGPVRLKVEERKQEVANLKTMIKDKMILDDQEISDVLEENEGSYKSKVQKALRRA